jgi:hypothetical protein
MPGGQPVTDPDPTVVDEWIYLAVDHQDGDRHALISGLTMQRRPGRFTPIHSLNTLADTDAQTEQR